jgi:hypothetical protein
MTRKLFCSGLFVSVVLIGLSIGFAKTKTGKPADSKPFQMTIRMFAGTEPAPIAEHRILFDHGMIYALPNNQQEQITVIDESRKLVTLLDRGSQKRASIDTASLLQLTSQLRAAAATDELKQRLGITANVQVDHPAGLYSVAYGEVSYATTTQYPTDPEAAVRFGRFSDWALRLNIARKLGMPPFGRMLMNSQIAADGRIPLQTELHVQQGNETANYRSTHEITYALNSADRDRIDEVAGMMALYQEVPLAELGDH